MARLIAILVFFLAATGCESKVENAPAEVEAVTTPIGPEKPAPQPGKPTEGCVTLASAITACPDLASLRKWAADQHQREPEEESLATPLEPADPVEIRDGLVIYDELVNGIARVSRSHLDLWANTPTFNDAELARFRASPELWKSVVAFRAGSANEQIRAVQNAIRGKQRDTLRAILLRNGVLYLEDEKVAQYAGKHVALHHLFDVDELELYRAGLRYVLRRGDNGRYVHHEPALDEALVTFHMFDRVGPPGELPPLLSYELQQLRRDHGLSHVEVREETEVGREATIRFFDGQQYEGAVMLTSGGVKLAAVATPEELLSVRESNVRNRETMCALLATADTMVRERLEFDEPKVENGQQDGLLRPRFESAHASGQSTYRFNGVTYRVFDKDGRPRVPQLCIDFITDAVDRFQGKWWDARGEDSGEGSDFDMRQYMRFRTVRNLLQMSNDTPQIAHVHSLPPEKQIPYGKRGAFFDNLWDMRNEVRDGDVIVIYGLRADNLNHFHSFYVRETDPVYGVPTVLAANPGFARVQAWHDVMWESPRRSIRHRVRWNPDWIRAPQAVDLAVGVMSDVRAITSALAAEPPGQVTPGEEKTGQQRKPEGEPPKQ